MDRFCPNNRIHAASAGVLASLLGAVALLAPGCARIEHRGFEPGSSPPRGALASIRPAPEAETATRETSNAIPGPDAWPARWPHHRDGAAADTPRGVIRSLDTPNATLELTWLRRGGHLAPRDDDRADVDALLATLPDGADRPAFFRTEGPGSFTIVAQPADVLVLPPIEAGQEIDAETVKRLLDGTAVFADDTDTPDPQREPTEYLKFISAVPDRAPDGSEGIAIQRTWFAHYAPLDPNTREPVADPRGVVVILPGMFGTPQNLMRATAIKFRQRGWHVVRMLVHPARMTERVAVQVGADSAEAAAEIAAVLDDRAAEAAYATRAALDHLSAQHDALADLPHAVVGFSGGALLLPTAVALDPDRYDAAVLVAGGENVLEILDNSSYADWINALDLDWSESQSPRASVYDEYLIASELDPAHTAAALDGKALLVLHADTDQAVPASSGERLWRRLGRPERWRFPLGHEFLFLAALPFNIGAIADWLDEHTPAAPIARAGTSTETGSAE